MLEFTYYGAIWNYILCPSERFPNFGDFGKSVIRKVLPESSLDQRRTTLIKKILGRPYNAVDNKE